VLSMKPLFLNQMSFAQRRATEKAWDSFSWVWVVRFDLSIADVLFTWGKQLAFLSEQNGGHWSLGHTPHIFITREPWTMLHFIDPWNQKRIWESRVSNIQPN
jgi:hypothetical protein